MAINLEDISISLLVAPAESNKHKETYLSPGWATVYFVR